MTIQHYQTTHKGKTRNLAWTFICAASSTKAANTITPPGQSDLSQVLGMVDIFTLIGVIKDLNSNVNRGF